ncbi:MAG TPA: flagellar basal body P-ring protein FlgI [Terriglobia bacterium]|nr:flagellar basal body P-ring protein FlgI [Terriglobia bacterium]
MGHNMITDTKLAVGTPHSDPSLNYLHFARYLALGRPSQILVFLFFFCCQLPPSPAFANSRVKDVARIQGVRDNQLVGYGLVVGLNKTGDRRQTIFSTQTLLNMLERMGVTVASKDIRVENIAAVMVTGELSPFIRAGGRIDCTVSSIGDARSLQGGMLVQTPMKAANGLVYAVAQGPVTIGGFTAGNAFSSVQVNHPTVGRIPNGAIVEREVPMDLLQRDFLDLVLDENDFTTTSRLEAGINQALGAGLAKSLDGRTVRVQVPQAYKGKLIDLIVQIENVQIQTDRKAKVVLNERTGTVVIGKDVRISAVAITQGNLSIEIGTDFNVSQPAPYSKLGETVVVPEQTVKAEEKKNNLVMLHDGATVEDLVKALNSLGVTPKDMVAIFQAIKASGALEAELEII